MNVYFSIRYFTLVNLEIERKLCGVRVKILNPIFAKRADFYSSLLD